MSPADALRRISDHFILADFLGNHTVYSKGVPNPFVMGDTGKLRRDNLTTLCECGLETILANWGPLSVSYGFICDALSKAIVKYQDPMKPSHHRFDLGAAADIIVHKWVQEKSPVELAHAIDQYGLPYSRMITYSESPYICLALSDHEVSHASPRKAFYENRYTGKKGVKPQYLQYASPQAKEKARKELEANGLPVPWEGAGYPTYHGGGAQQYHHRRVSKYTMLSDWLMDLQSIATGGKNVPAITNAAVMDAFAAAGMVYDALIDTTEVDRLSIVSSYVSRLNPNHDSANDWYTPDISFVVAAPVKVSAKAYLNRIKAAGIPSVKCATGTAIDGTTTLIKITLNVDEVLGADEWPTPL